MAIVRIHLIDNRNCITEFREVITTNEVACVIYGQLDAVLSKADAKLKDIGKPKSEQLKEQAATEDNDLTYLGVMNKALRERRVETWEDYKQKIIDNVLANGGGYQDVPEMGKIIFVTNKFGTLDFYPKANKVLIRKENKWKKPGLNWIINNLM